MVERLEQIGELPEIEWFLKEMKIFPPRTTITSWEVVFCSAENPPMDPIALMNIYITCCCTLRSSFAPPASVCFLPHRTSDKCVQITEEVP